MQIATNETACQFGFAQRKKERLMVIILVVGLWVTIRGSSGRGGGAVDDPPGARKFIIIIVIPFRSRLQVTIESPRLALLVSLMLCLPAHTDRPTIQAAHSVW